MSDDLEKHGAICNPGGRTLQISSKHAAWLDWATKTLYEAAEREKQLQTMKNDDFPGVRYKMNPQDH